MLNIDSPFLLPKCRSFIWILACSLVLPWPALAANKVVVIPMAGDDIIPSPFRPLTAASPPDTDYTITANTVVDKKTGLEWQRLDDDTTRTWDVAMTYCSDLTLDSKTDWRLPEVSELQSIVKYDASSPAINGVAFPGTNSSYYWSASSYAAFSSSAWRVNFNVGNVSASDKTGSYYVRCVR